MIPSLIERTFLQVLNWFKDALWNKNARYLLMLKPVISSIHVLNRFFFEFQARHIVQVSVRAPLAKQAVIQAAVHPRLHRIKCNIRHRRSTASLSLYTPTKIHGNVQSPAPGTSTFALHTALPVAATPKEEHASKYINFNLKFSVVLNFSLTLSSCNWRKPNTYLSRLHLALRRNSVTGWDQGSAIEQFILLSFSHLKYIQQTGNC